MTTNAFQPKQIIDSRIYIHHTFNTVLLLFIRWTSARQHEEWFQILQTSSSISSSFISWSMRILIIASSIQVFSKRAVTHVAIV